MRPVWREAPEKLPVRADVVVWWHSEVPQRFQDIAVGCELLQNGGQVVGCLYAALTLHIQRGLRPLRENMLL